MKVKVKEGDLETARQILEKAVASSDGELKNVARIRLIRRAFCSPVEQSRAEVPFAL